MKSKYELMFKFVKESNVLSYYYKQNDKKKELTDFVSSFNEKSSILLTKLKSYFYRD